MKIPAKPLLWLAAVLLLATSPATFAQSTWQTVDELIPWRGRDIVADAYGNFISLAIDNSTSSSGPVSTAVSVSRDGGATWDTVGFIAGYALDLTVAPDGALFATGNRTATVSGRAFLWQSLDHGVTWTVSDPAVGLSAVLIVSDVAAGNTDSIYVCGTSGGRRMVRKGVRTTSGITWSTVDYPAISGVTSIFVRPGVAGQPDEVLTCGAGWIVRRSTNSGATWTTLANPVSPYSGNASGVVVANDGSIIVSGTASKKTGTTTQSGWLTRRSTNGGATWTDVDFVVNGWPLASITADNFGRVFAAGYINTTPNAWVVRGSVDGGVTWVSTDSFANNGTTRAQAQAVAVDALGNVCVVGETGSTAATYTAPIRRLAAP